MQTQHFHTLTIKWTKSYQRLPHVVLFNHRTLKQAILVTLLIPEKVQGGPLDVRQEYTLHGTAGGSRPLPGFRRREENQRTMRKPTQTHR